MSTLSNNMIECPICNFHFHENRTHCPTCGALDVSMFTTFVKYRDIENLQELKVAHGAERARQLPQSPRFFQLVD